MRISIGFIGIIIVTIVLYGCTRIKPQPPKETTLDSTLAVPLSTINIPISYEVEKLQDMVNKKLDGVFLDQWIKVNDKGDSLYLQLEKRKDIKLSWDSKVLAYSIPLNVSARFKKSIAGIRIVNNEPIRAQLTLYLSSVISINEKWNLETKSTIKKIHWITDPRLKVAFVKINLRKAVESLIQKKESMLLARLDDLLAGVIDTRKVVSKIWNDLQKPIRINKKGIQVWLKTQPEDMSARFINDEDLIAIQVELKARVLTMFDTDTASSRKNELPKFHKKLNDSTHLSIFLLSKVPFELTNRILKRELEDRKLEAQGYSTTIKKLNVYGVNDGLAFRLKVRGDVDGVLYAVASPGFDTSKSLLYAKSFSFNIDSENALLNSADWLLHDHVLDSLSKTLFVDVKPLVDSLPSLIEYAVGKGRAGEKIELTVDELKLKPVNYLVTKDNFQVLFHATGRASIALKQKVFVKAGKKKKRAL